MTKIDSNRSKRRIAGNMEGITKSRKAQIPAAILKKQSKALVKSSNTCRKIIMDMGWEYAYPL